MKKTNLIKGLLIILLSIMLVGTTSVFAAGEELDFSNLDDESNSASDGTDKNNTNTNNSNRNTNSNNSNKNTNNANTNNTNRNSSSYNNTNNTDLPKTGIEDSIPTVVLIVVFGISAIYAYKKISDYRKI